MWFRAIGLSCVALVAPAQAADQLQFGSPPSWVVSQQVPAPSAEPGNSPIEILLSDAQVNLQPDALSTYSHTAIRINNAQGLAAGSVAATWDPEFDSVTIHQVTIRRGGQTIDVLGNGQKFTILRREQDLEQQTLNGQLTATLQPEGLQVGDIVELEMSLIRRDPTLQGHMELNSDLTIPISIDQARLRVLIPSKAAVRQRVGRGLPAASISKTDGATVSTWTLSGLPVEQPPEFAPPRYASNRRLEITDFQSWNVLAALFLPLYEKASIIAPEGPLRQEIDRIKTASADPIKRAELALQLVEQKVRYVNLALGVGGLVPSDTNETWKRRFGDCKAKSVLLTGLLRELGIDAVPVLVNTEAGDGLNERLPMVGLFNHVLVRAVIGGKTFWLDGTRTGDTTLEALEVPYHHWGLPIVRNADLVKILPSPRTRPDIETIIRTNASAGVAEPVPTTIEIVMRGDLAILQNVVLSSVEPDRRDEAIIKQLESKLDRFEVEKHSATYDAAAQVYRLRGEGLQTLDLNGGVYWTEVPSPGYKADFRRTSKRDLDAPVEIGFPSYKRTVQTIVIPKDRVRSTTFQVAPINTIVAGVEYRQNVTNADGVVTIDATTRSLVPEIAYAEALASEERLRELDKGRIWIRLSSSTPVAASEVKELIGREPKGAADYFDAARKLMANDDGAKAIGALDKALEIAPSNTSAREFRAQLRVRSGDLEGARSDAQVALKANSNSPSMRSVLAEIYRLTGNSDAARAEAAALAKIDNVSAQLTSAQILLSLDDTEQALTALDRALAYEKDPMTHFYRAQAIPQTRQEERRRELEAALKLNPADDRSLVSLARLARQVGEYDKALSLLDQAFLRSPDNLEIRHVRAIALLQAKKTDAANREFDAIAAKELSALELNNLCWEKAMANVALERALEECDRSLAKDDLYAAHDSKGVILLRQSRYDDAIKEFDLALKDGEVAESLYGRSLAYAGKGDRVRSDADAAQANKLSPGIERTYGHDGMSR